MGVESLQLAPVSTDGSFAGVNFSNSLLDDQNKKIRKPYTITKSRQNWTDSEHDRFLEALHLFDRDWKKIEAFVGSKTAIQIRSHAQKYFLKVQKSGTNEHVPPPRPKRKAAHPYPHKAPKNDVAKAGGMSHTSTALIEPQNIIIGDSYSWPTSQCSSACLSSWRFNAISPVDATTQVDDVRSTGPTGSNNCCSSSIDSGPGTHPPGETNDQQTANRKVLPDFPKVYKFIGSVFDPNVSNHLHKLKTMDPVDVETVVLLMKNLCANLRSPEFDGYRRLFSSYDAKSGKLASNDSFNGFHTMSGNAIPSS